MDSLPDRTASTNLRGDDPVWEKRGLRTFANPHVIPLTPTFMNTYLVWGERPLLVDTGMPATGRAIESALAERGLNPGDLSMILMTHGHYDHFGGASYIKALGRAPVAVHKDDAARLVSGAYPQVVPLTWMGRLMSSAAWMNFPPAPVTPDVLLTGDESLADYGLDGRLIHTPGHTRGSLSLLVNEIAVIGDVLAGSLLAPNRPSFPYFIDDPDDKPHILTSVQRLLDEGVHVFFPGHGLPFDRAAVLKWLSANR